MSERDDLTHVTDDVAVTSSHLIVKETEYKLPSHIRITHRMNYGIWQVPSVIAGLLAFLYSFLMFDGYSPANTPPWLFEIKVLHLGLAAVIVGAIGAGVSFYAPHSIFVKTASGTKVRVFRDVRYPDVAGYKQRLRAAMGR